MPRLCHLRGEAVSSSLRRDSIRAAAAQRRPRKSNGQRRRCAAVSALKANRRGSQRRESGRIHIFNDRTLIEMAENGQDIGRDGAYRRCWGDKSSRTSAMRFSEVINGAAAEMHPTRRKLAGRAAGSVFVQLQESKPRLSRGCGRGEKTLSCSTSLLGGKWRNFMRRNLDAIEPYPWARNEPKGLARHFWTSCRSGLVFAATDKEDLC